MKVIIAGGRDFNKPEMVLNAAWDFKKKYGDINEIVCGMASGADMCGYHFAKKYSIPIKEFPANWVKFGKSAGFKRNYEMAKYADAFTCVLEQQKQRNKNDD